MGGGSGRSAAGAGGRIGSPPTRRDLCGQHAQCSGDEGRDHDDSDCLRLRWRSGPARVVASFNRPGGNATGVNLFTTALELKKLELLHEFVPKAAMIGILLNPSYVLAETQSNDLRAAAGALGRQIHVVSADNENDIDAAFVTLAERRIGSLLVTSIPIFTRRRDHLVALAARHAIPAIYGQREFVAAGGLMSYGTNLADAYRQVGVYTGRILKGEKPADLPVLQPTKFELLINLKTAKALGLDVPPTLLARADEVIE